MWSPRLSPMVAIIVAEFAATARPSIRVFQTLLAGKTGQNGAPGRVGAVPTAFETRSARRLDDARPGGSTDGEPAGDADVRSPRICARLQLLGVGPTVAIRILPPIRDAVAVGVGAMRVGMRTRSLPRVRQAVAIRVGRGHGCGGQQEPGDQRDRREDRAQAPKPGGHTRIVRPGRAGGNASDVPSRAARWSGSAGHR